MDIKVHHNLFIRKIAHYFFCLRHFTLEYWEQMSVGVKRFLSPLCRSVRLYVELDDKWRPFKHLKGAYVPKEMQIFWFYLFFFEGKQFSALFISVNNNKRHCLQIYLSALLTTKDKNAAFTQAVLSVQRGLCSWCCSTSNGKYVF